MFCVGARQGLGFVRVFVAPVIGSVSGDRSRHGTDKGAGRDVSERIPRSGGESDSARSTASGPAKDSAKEPVAVALRYAPENALSAPKVVASGRGAQIGRAHV